ncbi:MAG: hypothetical protein ACRDTG_04900, partial [Pseudonocardiaceae bacterium]
MSNPEIIPAVFEDEVVVLSFGEEALESFILNGGLPAAESGVDEQVTVNFPDGTQGSIRFFDDNQVIVQYGDVQVDLLIDDPSNVQVNGSVIPLTSAIEPFSQENDFTGIGPLSDLSRAFLIPIALGSAPAWQDFIGELRSTEEFVTGE